MFKLLLYLLVFSTSSLIGFMYGGIYSKRVNSLILLQQAIRLLQGEVIIFANPLPDALVNISKKISGEVSKVFVIIKEDLNINQSGDVYESFLKGEKFLRDNCGLQKMDTDLFLSLGKVIGKTNREDQERQFSYVLNELDLIIVDAKNQMLKNEKLYRSLGVLLGLGMIIILI